jgi:hypothetical protein
LAAWAATRLASGESMLQALSVLICAPCSGTAFATAACCFAQRGVRQAWRRCANEPTTRGGACGACGACAGWHLLTHLGLLVHSGSHAFLCGAHYRGARVSPGRAHSPCARAACGVGCCARALRRNTADQASKPAKGELLACVHRPPAGPAGGRTSGEQPSRRRLVRHRRRGKAAKIGSEFAEVGDGKRRFGSVTKYAPA